MTVCSCKYPLIIVDERDGKEITFLAMPLEVLEEDNRFGYDNIPDMEVVETESLTGIIGQYMKVTWKKAHSETKKYDVVGHIVIAGCEEGALQCDTKNIYEVYHPVDEWIKDHIVELKS
jgi:hypothetical protein